MIIDFLGNIFLCDCDGWLPIPVGKVRDFLSIDEIFSSDVARVLQKDVKDQNFSWCAVDHCGIRDHDRIKTQLDMSINIDESCNLHCPSCRRDPIMISQGPIYDSKIEDVNRILSWLDSYDRPVHVTISGNGDALASHIMRPIVRTFQPRPGQTFTLFTNGLLIKKQVSESMPIFDSITKFKISVDAGSQEVYEDVRRPGRWSVLLENFEYLRSLGKSHLVTLNFALQYKNHRDVGNFINLCHEFGFQGSIHNLDDWGTWSKNRDDNDAWTQENGYFDDHDVLSNNHPCYQDAKTIILEHQGLKNIVFHPMIRKQLKIG